MRHGDSIIVLVGLTLGSCRSVASTRGCERLHSDVHEICRGVLEYRDIHGAYPRTLSDLTTARSGATPLISRLPVDPWGKAYRYDCPTDSAPGFRVYTLGADNHPGGVGVDADFGSESILLAQ